MRARNRKSAVSAAAKHPTALSVLMLACIPLLVWGWSVREEVYWTARRGTGYALGIVGTVFMTALLLYSLRKRLRFMRGWGEIRHWFNVHMMLGILAPVAILFHANFDLGSLNSNVALSCMILVASSGVVGRMIYPKIHHGLFGRRTTLKELRGAAESSRSALGAALAGHPPLARELQSFESFALAGAGLLSSTWRLVRLGGRTRGTRRRCLRQLSTAERSRVEKDLHVYLDAVRRAAGFRFYERVFALWHAFHLPLCIMLFAAAAVHIVAVHLY